MCGSGGCIECPPCCIVRATVALVPPSSLPSFLPPQSPSCTAHCCCSVHQQRDSHTSSTAKRQLTGNPCALSPLMALSHSSRRSDAPQHAENLQAEEQCVRCCCCRCSPLSVACVCAALVRALCRWIRVRRCPPAGARWIVSLLLLPLTLLNGICETQKGCETFTARQLWRTNNTHYVYITVGDVCGHMVMVLGHFLI